MTQFDTYFSNGLKQKTSKLIYVLYMVAIEHGPGMKLHFLLNMGIFQPAMLV